MALLGNIAANSTGVINLDFVPEQIVVVDSTTGIAVMQNVTQLSIVQSGRQLANLTGGRVGAFARLKKFIYGAAQLMGQWLEIAAGRVNGSTTITITHSTANAVNVYGVSSSFSDQLINYVETSINANANQSFDNFSALMLSTPNNIDRVNITFSDGFNDDFTVPELKALISTFQNTDADGLLNGNLAIPNIGIRTAIVFVNSLGSCVVGVQRIVQS